MMDLSLGNGFSMQVFSQDLHLPGPSQPVVQFRVRDTQQVRVWTFQVQLMNEVSSGSHLEVHDRHVISVSRRGPSSTQYWLESLRDVTGERTVVVSDVTRPQTGGAPRPALRDVTGERTVGVGDATRPQTGGAPRPAQSVGGPRPPALRPPAHLVRPGTISRPHLQVRPGARPEARPPLSAAITGALRSRERSRSARVGSSSEYDQARIAADLVNTGALPSTGDMNASQPRGPKRERRDRGMGRGAGR